MLKNERNEVVQEVEVTKNNQMYACDNCEHDICEGCEYDYCRDDYDYVTFAYHEKSTIFKHPRRWFFHYDFCNRATIVRLGEDAHDIPLQITIAGLGRNIVAAFGIMFNDRVLPSKKSIQSLVVSLKKLTIKPDQITLQSLGIQIRQDEIATCAGEGIDPKTYQISVGDIIIIEPKLSSFDEE